MNQPAFKELITNKSTNDLVSIIIPNHNRDDLLFDTLDSCLSQTYPKVEIIIVDDGSDEAVRQKIRKRIPDFQRSQPLLRYYEIDRCGGCAARNKGVRLATGQYFQFLDSDDLLHKEKISRAMNIFEKFPQVDCVYGNREDFEIDEKGVLIVVASICVGPDLEARPGPAEAVLRSLWTSLPISKRELIRACGAWDEELTSHQDWEYGFRLISVAKGVAYDPGGVAYCRRHSGPRLSKQKFGHPPSIFSLTRASLSGLRVLKWDISYNTFLARFKLIKNIVSALKVSIQTRQAALFFRICRAVIGR